MLGIIILNYKNDERTMECVASIRSTYQEPYRIYIVDNGSANGSYERLQAAFGQEENITLIESTQNLGYARGNNLALEKAFTDQCDYVIISNNDIICKERTIKTLLECFHQHSDYFIIAPKIISPDGSLYPSVKRGRPTYLEYLQTETYLRNIFRRKNQEKALEMNQLRMKSLVQVYWVEGSFFLVDLKKFQNMKYFDPYTFLYFEEFILSEKARRNGMKIGYCPKATVVHYHGASTGSGPNLVTRITNFRSECYVMKKYFGWSAGKKLIVWIIRNLEVLWTFGKAKQYADIRKYLKKSYQLVKIKIYDK